jgi:hypothetical protein
MVRARTATDPDQRLRALAPWRTFLLLVVDTGDLSAAGHADQRSCAPSPAWRTRPKGVCSPLLVGDPATVEAERNARGQVNARDRIGGEVLGSEDDQVGGAAVGIVHERHDVAVVLGRIS